MAKEDLDKILDDCCMCRLAVEVFTASDGRLAPGILVNYWLGPLRTMRIWWSVNFTGMSITVF